MKKLPEFAMEKAPALKEGGHWVKHPLHRHLLQNVHEPIQLALGNVNLDEARDTRNQVVQDILEDG
jgi:hypothetical protein